MNTYVVCENYNEGQRLLNIINKDQGYPSPNRVTKTFCEILNHPFLDKVLITYHSSIKDEVPDPNSIIDQDEAERQGWYFGFYKGKFAWEKQKREDLLLHFDILKDLYKKPLYPAFHSMTLSLLNICYSIKDSIERKSKNGHMTQAAEQVFKNFKPFFSNKNEAVKIFDIYYQSHKHGGSAAGVHSYMKFRPKALVSTMIVPTLPAGASSGGISAEGFYSIVDAGTPYERRIFPPTAFEASFSVEVTNPPARHKGNQISETDLLKLIKLVVEFYCDLVFQLDKTDK